VRQLLWLEETLTTEYQVVNKFCNAALGVQDKNDVVCFDLGDRRSNNQTWIITVDEETSLLTLTHKQKKLELSKGHNFSPIAAQTGVSR
jgi:hypothetical protein